jgi:uncharacterized protein YbjT (DUF2867 family)
MILVTGTSGPIPTSAVQFLKSKGAKVRVLARDPKKAEGLGVEVVQGDLSRPETLGAAFRGVTGLLLVTPVTPEMLGLHKNALAAAKEAGVQKVVKVSAWGAAPTAPMALGRWHAETDQLLRDSGLRWVVLQPHGFMQNTFGYAASIKGQNSIFAPLGEGRVCYIDSRDIGEVAGAVLLSDRFDNRDLELTGPVAFSYQELAAAFSEGLGKKITYVNVPPDATRQAMIGAGFPAWLADDLIVLSGFYAANYASTPTTIVAEVLGKSGRTLADFIRDHRAAFAG